MTKNITLSISDDISKDMEEMSEVNWSAVARKCIKQYIQIRKNPDISSLLEELQRQKGEDYAKGRRKVEEIAKTSGYSWLNMLFRKYQKEAEERDANAMRGQVEPWDHLPSYNDIMETMLVDNGIIKQASDEFLKGFRERLLEIEDALTK